MNRLRDVHAGETAYIVGRGPSLLASQVIGPGPVIALNYALTSVRKMGLPNTVYSLQKDGCVPVYWAGEFVVQPDERTCLGSPCSSGPLMVQPIPPEILLVNTPSNQPPTYPASRDCFPLYTPRYSFDCADFGVEWHTMSAAVAVLIARHFGCTQLVMIGHDAYVSGDTRRVEPNGQLHDDPHAGYALAGLAAAGFAEAANMPIEWRA